MDASRARRKAGRSGRCLTVERDDGGLGQCDLTVDAE